ncbi:AbrB/MazE/SpoVT family DNA-binding domain-containing protein [Candidatus Woesearchaeota archaeon]|nr:AbrB/MazE/SpoVT family DNA-binding domain-containing protein [Candidatus Woesearchaeota archaeon]
MTQTIICGVKKWGNSLGIIIPKEIVRENKIHQHEEIVIEIKGKQKTVLEELFGAIKFSKPTKILLKEARKDLESKY